MRKLYRNPSLSIKLFCDNDIVTTSGDFVDTIVSFDKNWIEQGGGF